MSFNATPVFILLMAVAIALVGVYLAVFLVLREPYLGVTLVADADSGLIGIEAVDPAGPARHWPRDRALAGLDDGAGHKIKLTATDLIEDPDSFDTYAQFNEFLTRQDRIHTALSAPSVTASIRGPAGSQWTATARPWTQRPLSSLPATFWVQGFVALAGLLIGIWVWSLKIGEWGAFFFAQSGVGLFLGALSAAVYGTRELALSGDVFNAMSTLNYVGATLLGTGMISLFLAYPVRLVPTRLMFVPQIVLGGWLVADALRVFPDLLVGRQVPGLITLVALIAAIGLQYRASRRDPRSRAAVRVFGLSVALGVGAFILMIVIPKAFNTVAPLSQGYAILLFLIVYGGAAFGVLRYRLFDLEEWAFRILFYFSAVALLIAVDAALVFLVSFERIPAFSVSLVAVALVYLPLRDVLTRVFLGRRRVDREALFGQVVDVALTPPGESQTARWRALLTQMFDPLNITETGGVAASSIDAEGMALEVPGIASLAPLRLEHAGGGRRLFTPRDAALAGEMVSMLGHAVESRNAYERGATEERARIARDMHDNIGAQLLSALHSKGYERKDLLIRESISDLRDIINNAAHGGRTLEEALADLKVEAAERLAAAGITLDWQGPGGEGGFALAPNVVHSLRSILREAVSNTIRHSGAKAMSVRIEVRDGTIRLDLADDGKGIDPSNRGNGNGLANIEARLVALKGTIDFANEGTGMIMRARFPLTEGASQ